MAVRDPFAEHDAAYVFGALAPDDRAEFEAHMAGCDSCRRAVADLAGLPGLLARVPIGDVIETSNEAPPGSLLPALLTQAARERRRFRLRTTVGGLLAAACILAAIVLALRLDGRNSRDTAAPAGPSTTTSAPAAAQRTMTVVGATDLQATLAIQPVAWGTRIEMHCTYPPADPGLAYSQAYQLRAVLRDGTESVLASWNSVAGKTLRIEGDSAAAQADIRSVQITDGAGQILLALAN